MRITAAAIALLLFVLPATAEELRGCEKKDPENPPVECTEHDCSDDTIPVFGNEWQAFYLPEFFDPDGDGTEDEITRFQVGIDTGGGFVELCAVIHVCNFSPYQLLGCFPKEGRRYLYAVRACGSTEVGCADWPKRRVEFWGAPYACFGELPDGTACEEPCYFDDLGEPSPRRYPEMPGCLTPTI